MADGVTDCNRLRSLFEADKPRIFGMSPGAIMVRHKSLQVPAANQMTWTSTAWTHYRRKMPLFLLLK
jgi:hypothetical protein